MKPLLIVGMPLEYVHSAFACLRILTIVKHYRCLDINSIIVDLAWGNGSLEVRFTVQPNKNNMTFTLEIVIVIKLNEETLV